MVKIYNLPLVLAIVALVTKVSSFTFAPIETRLSTKLCVSTPPIRESKAKGRDLRFKGAVNFRPVEETSYFEGVELSQNPTKRGQQLVDAAINVAKKRDPDQLLFIQTVVEIASR